MSELFRMEVMSNIPSKEHKEEHDEINDIHRKWTSNKEFDCNKLTPERHLQLHLDHHLRTNKITEEEYKRYRKDYTNNGIK